MIGNYCEVVFQDSDEQLVVFTEYVLSKLSLYRQNDNLSYEAAGVLIGERRGCHLVVCDLSVPGEGDIRSRYGVNRKGKHHQKKVDDCFRMSGGFQQYLGEWHTHPEDIPTPSYRDKQSWISNIVETKAMVVVIVGRKKMWVGKKECNQLISMEMKSICY